ncbi:hypothetical protein ABCR94_23540 [Streptomyces sp. 21So2-11]|uniref:hypothetical protein n=1 Tax=Streptomyces sp. 21So2-11 TaxID=3144408 RepID=UPI00321B7576
MTHPPLAPASAGPSPARPAAHPPRTGPLRRTLRAVAIASCLAYLALKVSWIAGSRVGIPEGSVLLEKPGVMVVANSVTVLMDGAVIVLALLLTQNWGRRVPAWLLALPMWVAGGLLTPIMTAYPLQLVVKLVTGSPAAPASSEPFLDEWVFAVVYTGFILQGLTLGTLFVLYARERWGHLWQGCVRALPRGANGPVLRTTAAAGCALAALSAVPHLMWAFGATAGLGRARIEQRTADFYLIEGAYALFACAAVAGVLMLLLRRGGRLPLKAPLALAWVGSGALGCWGGWLLMAGVMPTAEGTDGPTEWMLLTYAVQMTAGFLVLASGASFLRRRAA